MCGPYLGDREGGEAGGEGITEGPSTFALLWPLRRPSFTALVGRTPPDTWAEAPLGEGRGDCPTPAIAPSFCIAASKAAGTLRGWPAAVTIRAAPPRPGDAERLYGSACVTAAAGSGCSNALRGMPLEATTISPPNPAAERPLGVTAARGEARVPNAAGWAVRDLPPRPLMEPLGAETLRLETDRARRSEGTCWEAGREAAVSAGPLEVAR